MGGKQRLYICACEESMASGSGCHCSKNPQLFSLHVCPLHVRSTTGRRYLTRGVKLAGWVRSPPHPEQDQIKKWFPDAVRSKRRPPDPEFCL